MESAAATRKLIDIPAPVFKRLSVKAEGRGVSLKKYIENLLEENALNTDRPELAGITDSRVLSLIGLAGRGVTGQQLETDRLNYILSK